MTYNSLLYIRCESFSFLAEVADFEQIKRIRLIILILVSLENCLYGARLLSLSQHLIVAGNDRTT